jgi:hypothetical protein
VNIACSDEPDPWVSAVDVYAHSDFDAILVLVIAVDNAEEVDRGLAHHLEPAAKPGFPGACPGSYKTFIGAAVQRSAFPCAP